MTSDALDFISRLFWMKSVLDEAHFANDDLHSSYLKLIRESADVHC